MAAVLLLLCSEKSHGGDLLLDCGSIEGVRGKDCAGRFHFSMSEIARKHPFVLNLVLQDVDEPIFDNDIKGRLLLIEGRPLSIGENGPAVIQGQSFFFSDPDIRSPTGGWKIKTATKFTIHWREDLTITAH